MKRFAIFLSAFVLAAAMAFFLLRPAAAPRVLGSQSSTTLASVPTGPGGFCPLGFHQADPQTSTCSTDFAPVSMPASTPTLLMSIPLAPGDVGFFTFQTDTLLAGTTAGGGHAWNQGKWGLTYEVASKVMLDPTLLDAGQSVQSQIGGSLTAQNVYWQQSGSQLQLMGTCPSACAIAGNVDYKRESPPPWVLSVSPTTCNNTTGCTVTVTTTTGAAQYASSATFGVQVTSAAGVNTLSGGVVGKCTQVSTDATGSTASCVIAPGAATLTSGGLAPAGAVSMVSAANPFPLYGSSAFTFTAGGGTPPTITSIAPNECQATGTANTVTVTGTNFLTGMTFDYASLAASTCTIASATSATCACPTYSTANGTSALQPVTLCNGSNCVTGATEFTGVTVNPTNSTLVGWASGDNAKNTTSGTEYTALADMSPSAINFTAPTSSGPTVTANFNASGLNAATGNGTSFYMNRTTQITAANTGQCAVVQYPSTIASTAFFTSLDYTSAGPAAPSLLTTATNLLALADTVTASGSNDITVTPSAVQFVCGTTAGTSYILYTCASGTCTATGPATRTAITTLSGTDWLFATGPGPSGATFSPGSIGEVFVYNGTLASADVTTLYKSECGASGAAGRWKCL